MEAGIIVTCYAPRHIMDILQMEAEKHLDLLIKEGLLKLTMGYHIIWDVYTRDKVRAIIVLDNIMYMLIYVKEVKGLVEMVRPLEEKIVLKRKKKDKKMSELKSSLNGKR